MSGFGEMPFGSGPFGSVYTTPSATEQTQIVASRYIDGNGRFKQLEDGLGGFVGMNNTIQRAMILMALNVKRVDKIGADYASTTEADIRRALEVLTDQEKVLEIEEIEAVDNGTSQTGTRVVLRDLIDGLVHVVER